MKFIFNYTDYRKFLCDVYEVRKAKNIHFSHRYIAQKLGFNSGYFTRILKGERNISNALVYKFIEFLNLNKREGEYFEILVRFNQAKTHSEKKGYFEKLLSFQSAAVNLLSVDQYELFDKWYYMAVREVLAVFPMGDVPERLARLVLPAIKPSEAEKAVELLVRLNLIRKNEQGVYERCEKLWSSGAEEKAVGLI